MVDDDSHRRKENTKERLSLMPHISMLTAAAAEHSPPTCTTIIVEHQKQCAHHLPASSSVHRHNQVHGTGPWLFHLAMSAAGYDDLLRLYLLYRKRGAAEKRKRISFSWSPHPHQTECLNCTHRPTKRRTERRVWVFGSPHRRELSIYSKAATTARCGSSYQTSTPELSCQNSDSDPSPSSWNGSLISVLVRQVKREISFWSVSNAQQYRNSKHSRT